MQTSPTISGPRQGRNYQESVFPPKKSNLNGIGNALLPDTLPIAINITQKGSLDQPIVLFDSAARQFNVPIFGNCTISSTYNTLTYNQMLQALTDISFKCSYMRVINLDNPDQAIQPWFVTSVNMEGQLVSSPLPAGASFSPFQRKRGVIDLMYPLKMDALTKVAMVILGSAGTTTTTIYFYPDKTVNGADALLNGSPIRDFKAPNLPGAGQIK